MRKLSYSPLLSSSSREVENSRSHLRFDWIFAGLSVWMIAGLYLVVLDLTVGIWWTVHMWVGAIVLAGNVGWLITYAFVPPYSTNSS